MTARDGSRSGEGTTGHPKSLACCELEFAHGREAVHESRIGRTIGALYSRQPNHILPFMGAAFQRPRDQDLRVVVVGINSYVASRDWPLPPEGGFPHWFAQSKYRFFPAVKRDAIKLVSALVARGLFNGLQFAWPGSFYATNAIKTYLPEADGKRAHQVEPQKLAEHAAIWRDELDVLAEHSALPHLIVVFGRPFWKHAWSSFKPPHTASFKHLRVHEYQYSSGQTRHFANRLRLGGRNGAQTTLLLRLRHPASRTRKGSVPWLTEQDDFWELALP